MVWQAARQLRRPRRPGQLDLDRLGIDAGQHGARHHGGDRRRALPLPRQAGLSRAVRRAAGLSAASARHRAAAVVLGARPLARIQQRHGDRDHRPYRLHHAVRHGDRRGPGVQLRRDPGGRSPRLRRLGLRGLPLRHHPTAVARHLLGGDLLVPAVLGELLPDLQPVRLDPDAADLRVLGHRHRLVAALPRDRHGGVHPRHPAGDPRRRAAPAQRPVVGPGGGGRSGGGERRAEPGPPNG